MRWPRQLHNRSLFGLASALLLTGCGGPYNASVSGIVSLDEQNLERGTVAFFPTAGGPPAYGQIESDGSYTVRTGREDGIIAGEYQVTVAANEPPATQRSKSGGPPPPGKSITPIWYRSQQTSGLSITVEPGNNEIDLPLSNDPPPNWQDPRKRGKRR